MPMPPGDRTMLHGAARVAAAAAIVALGLAAPAEGVRAQDATAQHGGPAGPLPPRLLIGDWRAVVRLDNLPQPVHLQIHSVEPGETAGKLIYASPRRCFVDLQYGGADYGSHIFYMVPFTNCFPYKESDYVEITSVEALPRVFNDLSEDMPAYRHMPKDQGANAGASDAGEESGAGGWASVEQIEYRLSLGGREVEHGVLARQ